MRLEIEMPDEMTKIWQMAANDMGIGLSELVADVLARSNEYVRQYLKGPRFWPSSDRTSVGDLQEVANELLKPKVVSTGLPIIAQSSGIPVTDEMKARAIAAIPPDQKAILDHPNVKFADPSPGSIVPKRKMLKEAE